MAIFTHIKINQKGRLQFHFYCNHVEIEMTILKILNSVHVTIKNVRKHGNLQCIIDILLNLPYQKKRKKCECMSFREHCNIDNILPKPVSKTT